MKGNITTKVPAELEAAGNFPVLSASGVYDYNMSMSLEDINSFFYRNINNSSGNDNEGLILCTSDGWEVPDTIGRTNALKRMLYLNSVKWTPKTNIITRYRKGHSSGFYKKFTPSRADPAANITYYKGIPYGSAYTYGRQVGLDSSLYSFLTAVNNPYSLMYKLTRIDIYRKSDGVISKCLVKFDSPYSELNTEEFTREADYDYYYNNSSNLSYPTQPDLSDDCTYAFLGVASYQSCYYSLVCSSFSSYIFNMPLMHGAGQTSYFETQGMFERLQEQSSLGVRIGDLILNSEHHRLVSGVKRDNNGVVTDVIVTEAAGTITRITNYTAANFNASLNKNKPKLYTIWRCKLLFTDTPYLYEGDKYLPCKYNNDICTYIGDRVAFKTEEPIYLNYCLEGGQGGWSKVQIYKDGEFIEEVQLTESTNTNHTVKLLKDYGYGDFKARLVKGEGADTTYSDWTYWEVIDVNVNVTLQLDDPKTCIVNFVSGNSTPLAVQAKSLTGGQRYMYYYFTPEDRMSGTVTIDMQELMNKLYSGKYKTDVPWYFTVFFKGKYGGVISNFIKIDNGSGQEDLGEQEED